MSTQPSLAMSSDEIEKHLQFVHKIVNQMNLKTSTILDKDDLFSIGVIGLLDAYSKYNPTKKTSFETYARMRIRGTIMDEIRKLGMISRTRSGRVKAYQKAYDALEQILGRTPNDAELCQHLNVNESELSEIYDSMHLLSVLSLEEFLYEDTEGMITLNASTLQQENALTRLERLERYEELQRAIALLDPKEQQILQLYYVEGFNFNEISSIFQMSPSRVSQLYRQALHSLRFLVRR